jgi:sugar lactone lactonase YvrE
VRGPSARSAADALYATTAGNHGFQVVFRDTPDFSGPPSLIAQVPFAIGAVPVGAKSVEYRGIFNVTMPGTYGFALEAGSSAQLFVDDALVVDNGGSHAPREVRATLQLDTGPHTVSIQYTNPSPAPWAVSVLRPGGQWTLADGSEFTPPSGYTAPAIVTLALDPAWGANGRTSSAVAHPDGVAVLPDGSVVIGERGKLAILGPDGGERDVSVPVTDIGDLAATPDGHVALLDSTKYSLYVVDSNGAVLQHFDGVFASAAGVDVAAGAVYVASPRAGIVYRVPLPDGPVDQLSISNASTAVKASQPSDIAVGPDGTLYMADFEKAQLVISLDGLTSQKTLGANGTGAEVPRVALDGKLLLMTDPLNSRIIVFDLTGKQRGRFQFPQGVHATGIAVDAEGRVYAADNESGRVYRMIVTIPESSADLQP